MGPALFETSNQFWVFLFTVYGGAVLGLLYDLLYLVRETVAGRRSAAFRWSTAFFDILFWVMATALVFALLLYASEGEFHYYDVIGFVIGAALWRLGPGHVIRCMHERLMRGLRTAWNRLKDTPLFKLLGK